MKKHWTETVDYSKWEKAPKWEGYDKVGKSFDIVQQQAIWNTIDRLLAAVREYRLNEHSGRMAHTGDLMGWVETLYHLAGSCLDIEKDLGKDRYADLLRLVYSAAPSEKQKFNDYFRAWLVLRRYLYQKGVTRYDTRANYDHTQVELENEMTFER